MKEAGKQRARDEADSVCWTALVDGYTVYGRPRYWRVIKNSTPIGKKAGGFVKLPAMRGVLDGYYRGDTPLIEVRNKLAHLLDGANFLKEVVS
jgi:hypothetical protein